MKTALGQLKEKLLKDDGYKLEINKQDLPFDIAECIIDARIKKGMTQKELAEKLNTKQSGIARLESGKNYPSFKSLEKIARILDIKMKNPLGPEINNTTNCYFRLPVELLHNNTSVEQKNTMVNSVLYNI